MERLDELKRRLEGLRPLTRDDIQALWPRFEAEKPNFVYSTNAIENNTLTLGETIVVLQDGVTIGGKPLKDHVEALNSARAYDLMLAMTRDEKPITRNTMLALHEVICAGETHAGTTRDTAVYIYGAVHVPPNWTTVPARVDAMFDAYQKNVQASHPVAAGAILHFDLLTIHSFVDGNGRTARLINNLHLIKHGYPPVLIDPVDDKPDYLEVLKVAQVEGEPGFGEPAKFVGYMIGLEERALKHYLHVLEESRGRGDG